MTITKLKLKKVAGRLLDSHRIKMVYDDKVLQHIADRCTEVETGARNIDHILEGTLLPRISSEILARMAANDLPNRMGLGVAKDGDFSIDFETSLADIQE